MQAFVRHASRRWWGLSVAILPLLSAFTAGPLRAQGQSRVGQATSPERILPGIADTLLPYSAALTVEGGGTLGAYEAGLTWALVEVFRQRRMLTRQPPPGETTGQQLLRSLHPLDFRAAAGASAGSINAFIAAGRWCSIDPAETEKKSPFWQVWIPTGVSELLPKKRPLDWGKQKAVFTRDSYDGLFARLDASLDSSRYAPNCGLLFGAAITRLAQDSLLLASKVYARNQRYAAAFAIKGPPLGGRGVRYSRLERRSAIPLGAMMQLPDSAGENVISHGAVHELITASSGFPVAFAPQPITHCVGTRFSVDEVTCPQGTTLRNSYFVDGGVFDNGPLTIGYGLAYAGPEGLSLDSLYMLFVTPSRCRPTRKRCGFVGARHDGPSTQTTRTADPEKIREAQTDGLDALAKLLAVAIPSARQYELQVTGRILPTIDEAHQITEVARLALDSMKGEESRQKLRDSLQYEELKEIWIAARRDLGNLQMLNDSLRGALSQCRAYGECATEIDVFQVPRPLRTDWLAPAPSRVPVGPRAVDAVLARPTNTRFLFVTERWHPLAGDWLFGFGGFIGRPLREYDFYVGVYDALALIARRVVPAVQKDSTKFPGELKTFVTDPPIHMSPTARVILRALYNVEFSGNSASGIDLKLGSGDSARPSVSDSLLIAIVDAMREMSDSLPPVKKCRGGPIERMECSEGLDVAFAAMRRTPYFGRALEVAQRECAEANPGKERCSDDERFDDFVAEPYSALNRLTGKVLERLLDATPQKSALKVPLTVASAAYFATNERARTGADQGSVSLPPSLGPGNRKLMWLIPSSIGGYAGIPGWYYEWAGRWHLSPEMAIGATTRLIWASGLGGPASPHGRHTVPSIRVEHKFGGAGALWASTFGFDFAYWADWRHNLNNGGFRPTTFEKKAVSVAATSALFAQKIRVMLGYRPTKYVTRTKSKSRVLFSIGAGDVTGTLYWLYRGVR